MAIKCPDCGHMNDKEMSFCTECGEPLDPKVRLIMELEGKKGPDDKNGARSRSRNDDDDDDYIPSVHVEEKKFPVGLVIGLAAVAAVVWFLFFR